MALVAAFVVAFGSGVAMRIVATADRDPTSTEAILEAAVSVAPAGQAEALDDGHVSLAEQNAAIARVAECARTRGVNVEMRQGSEQVPDRVGFAAATLEAAEEARDTLSACQEEYSSEILGVFAAQSRPNGEQVVAGREFLRLCMADRGVDVPDVALEGDLISWATSRIPEISGANADCVDQHYRELGFWP